jgi:hypothetical protein
MARHMRYATCARAIFDFPPHSFKRDEEPTMKPRHYLIPALVSAMLAASGFALAEGAGGGAGGGSSSTGNAGATGTQPPDSAQGATSTSTTHKSTHHTSKKTHAKKPMNDTTNTPGADASSDTKGQ